MGHVGLCRGLVLASVVAVVAAAPARAQGRGGPGEIGFDFGFADFDSRVSDQSGARVGFRGGYRFTPAFQFEGQLLHMGADGISRDNPGNADDVALGAAMMNAVLSVPTRSNVEPYVLVGAGHANTEYDPGLFESGVDDTGLAWQAAVGARLYFGPSSRTALRVEISRLREDTFDAWKTHYALTAGMSWRLGR